MQFKDNDKLSREVLVLNKFYLASHIVDVRRAIEALCTGKCKVITSNYRTFTLKEWIEFPSTPEFKESQENYQDTISSPSVSLRVPRVIIIPTNTRTAGIFRSVKYSRKGIFYRDNWKCQYCFNKRKEMKWRTTKNQIISCLTVDHIVPKSKGGTNGWNNTITCCKFCNADKGDTLLVDLGWQIPNLPPTPQWNETLQTNNPYWKTFIN